MRGPRRRKNASEQRDQWLRISIMRKPRPGVDSNDTGYRLRYLAQREYVLKLSIFLKTA